MRREVQIARFWLNSCRVSQSLGSCAAIRSEALVTRMLHVRIAYLTELAHACIFNSLEFILPYVISALTKGLRSKRQLSKSFNSNSTSFTSFDKIKISCFTLPSTQHHSFFTNWTFMSYNKATHYDRLLEHGLSILKHMQA